MQSFIQHAPVNSIPSLATAGQRALQDNTTTEAVEAEAGEKARRARRTGDGESAAEEAAEAEVARAGEVLGETKWEDAVPDAGPPEAGGRGGGRRVGNVLIADPGYGFGAPYIRGSQSYEPANIKV